MARASIKDILPPQPHYISGYSGFVQGYKFDCGQSYGRLTHSLFEHRQRSDNASRPLLANLYAERPVDGQVDWKAIEKRRCRDRECRYTSNMVPGYAGHVPQYNFQCGKKWFDNAALSPSGWVGLWVRQKRGSRTRLLHSYHSRQKQSDGSQLTMVHDRIWKKTN